MRRFNWKRLISAIIIILIIAFAASVVLWMQATLGPSPIALAALQSDDQVSVSQESEFITFAPVAGYSSSAFILYPGAGIDPRSYAPILRQIAAQGHLAILLEMPLNLAILNPNAADQVIAEHPEIDYWVIGGHSLGGVVAARYVANKPGNGGLVFLAAYPANDALKDSHLLTLSIYGSLDGLTTPQDIDASRPLLPADTVFLEIKGGNHSQFGSYGLQRGDNVASISPDEQWSQIVEAIVTLLNTTNELSKVFINTYHYWNVLEH